MCKIFLLASFGGSLILMIQVEMFEVLVFESIATMSDADVRRSDILISLKIVLCSSLMLLLCISSLRKKSFSRGRLSVHGLCSISVARHDWRYYQMSVIHIDVTYFSHFACGYS